MLSEEKAKVYMDDVRTNMIATLTERRIRNLENLAMLADRVQVIDNDDEVGKNVAADYGPKSDEAASRLQRASSQAAQLFPV